MKDVFSELGVGLTGSPLWDSLPTAVYGCDADGRIRFYNKKAVEIWGRTPDLKSERYCATYRRFLLDGTELSVEETPMAIVLKTGEIIEKTEAIVERPDGSRLICRVNIAPILDEAGKVVGAVNCFQDVSGLIDALRSRDEFLSMASHELRTPITALRLQVEMRARQLSRGDTSILDPDVYARTLESDKRQIDRLSKLVDAMLDISRINEGKLPISKGWFNLAELVEDVIQSLLAQAIAANCELIFEADEVQGNWDFLRLEQVVFNLLSNAIKFGAGHPVHIRLTSSGGNAELSFTDHGPGIAPANQKKIFQRYERIPMINHPPGLGLGLYIARWIVELHDGQIRVDSAEGKGATFLVRLPITSH